MQVSYPKNVLRENNCNLEVVEITLKLCKIFWKFDENDPFAIAPKINIFKTSN